MCLRNVQRDEEAQKEVHERRRLEEVVMEQRLLIDALTAETLNLKDECTALQVRSDVPHKQTYSSGP